MVSIIRGFCVSAGSTAVVDVGGNGDRGCCDDSSGWGRRGGSVDKRLVSIIVGRRPNDGRF